MIALDQVLPKSGWRRGSLPDFSEPGREGQNVPKTVKRDLFDHLIGQRDQLRRDRR
jgi:hypothetical protein